MGPRKRRRSGGDASRQTRLAAAPAASEAGPPAADAAYVEVAVSPLQPLAFLGSAELRVVQGSLCVLGSHLSADSGWCAVHSPAGGLPLALQTLSSVSASATVHVRAIDPAPEHLAASSPDAPAAPADCSESAESGEAAADSEAAEPGGGPLPDRPRALLESLVEEEEGEEEECEEGEEEGEEGEEEGMGEEVEEAEEWAGEADGERAAAAAAEQADGPGAASLAEPSPAAAAAPGVSGEEAAPATGAEASAPTAVADALCSSLRLQLLPPTAAGRVCRLGALLPCGWEEGVEAALRHVGERSAGGRGGGPAVVVVVGARNSGKSSFLRLLANAVLANAALRRPSGPPAVGLLDCDVGQPELGPAGLLSLRTLHEPLLGPPLAHRRAAHVAADAAVCFGAASPAADPRAYVAAAAHLATVHAAAAAAAHAAHAAGEGGEGAPPLLVNTCGWVQGLGLQLLTDLVATLRPTALLVLERADGAAPFPLDHLLRGWRAEEATAAAAPAPPPAVLRVPALQPTDWPAPPGGGRAEPPPSASDAREMALLAYFGALPRGVRGLPPSSRGYASAPWQAAISRLLREPPLAARLSELEVRLLHQPPLPEGELLRSLNAAVVGLAARGGEGEADECLGLGIVRAVDPASESLLLVTPVPPAALARAAVLLRGSLELPVALLQPTPLTPASPYLGANALRGAGAGNKQMRSRNNIKRASTPRG